MADSQKFPLAKFPLTLAGFEKNRLFSQKFPPAKFSSLFRWYSQTQTVL